MLSLEQIQTYYSAQEQKFPRALLKEYLQYQLLDLIFSSPLGDSLVFTGGTSIRVVYGSDRFSEDLDFDVVGINDTLFTQFIEYLQWELEKRGIFSESRNVHKGVYRCYLRFPKLLHTYKLSEFVTEKILIQLDLAEKPQELPFEMHLINKFDVFKEIRAYSQEVLLMKKLEALLGRKRPKGRDIYDVVYLFSKTSLQKIDFSNFDPELGIGDALSLKKRLSDFVDSVDLKALAKDVQPFLLDPTKIDRILLFDRFVSQL
jgi:predicted nucleotidyltransferase component of viral defense system